MDSTLILERYIFAMKRLSAVDISVIGYMALLVDVTKLGKRVEMKQITSEDFVKQFKILDAHLKVADEQLHKMAPEVVAALGSISSVLADLRKVFIQDIG